MTGVDKVLPGIVSGSTTAQGGAAGILTQLFQTALAGAGATPAAAPPQPLVASSPIVGAQAAQGVRTTGPASQGETVSERGQEAVRSTLGFDPGDPAYFTYDEDPDLEAAQESKQALREYVEQRGSPPPAAAFLSDAGKGEAYYDQFQERNTAFQLGLTPEQAREYVTLQEAAHKIVHSHPDLAGKISDQDNEIIGDAASARLYPEQALFTNMFDMASGEAPEGYAKRHDLLKGAMGEFLQSKGLGTADEFIAAYDAYRDAQPTTGPDGRPVSDMTIFREFLGEFAKSKGGKMSGAELNKALQGVVSGALQDGASKALEEARG